MSYIDDFNNAVERCVQNTKAQFKKHIFSSFLIYMPHLDERVYVCLEEDMVILSKKSVIEKPVNINDFMVEGQVASFVNISPYGFFGESLIVKVIFLDFNFMEELKDKPSIFLVAGPEIVSDDRGEVPIFFFGEVGVSDIDSDFIYEKMIFDDLKEESRILLARKIGRGLGSGCSYSDKFLSDFYDFMRNETNQEILFSLILQCGESNMKNAKNELLPFLGHSSNIVREACYRALGMISDSMDFKSTLEDCFLKEEDMYARYMLLGVLMRVFSKDTVLNLIKKVDLTETEHRLLKRKGFIA